MPFRKSCRCGAGEAQVAECKWENGQPAVAGPFRGARNFIPLRSCAIMRHPHSLRSKATSFFLPSFLSQFAHCVRPSARCPILCYFCNLALYHLQFSTRDVRQYLGRFNVEAWSQSGSQSGSERYTLIGSTFYVEDRFFYLLLCFKILCDAPPSNGWKFQPSHILPSSESSRLFCCIAELAVGEKRIGLHVEVESGREIEERRGEGRPNEPTNENAVCKVVFPLKFNAREGE